MEHTRGQIFLSIMLEDKGMGKIIMNGKRQYKGHLSIWADKVEAGWGTRTKCALRK